MSARALKYATAFAALGLALASTASADIFVTLSGGDVAHISCVVSCPSGNLNLDYSDPCTVISQAF